jgi:hypothetical protein
MAKDYTMAQRLAEQVVSYWRERGHTTVRAWVVLSLPCQRPQNANVQFAPCQSPIRNHGAIAESW